eukprot:CAMPEP_0194037556 /NCGR_PEP_ID=MMETSP0009_2-20130614/9896_1 /TAXON_ID=210454 /ORGANISM="Grammatophora oceanica, Strain CCMP 410" /LENGTH=302 /DNA_ID=CAMNT_0038679765 /DNA_START=351 /DNA_END=1259 /DNA_ORIENTATION=+
MASYEYLRIVVPPSAPAELLKLETLHAAGEEGDCQDGVVVAATDNSNDDTSDGTNTAKDRSNLDVEEQTTVDSAESTTNASSTKAPSVQDERIVKAATTCTKIDFVRDSETKESEKSYTAALTGAGASLSDEKEANEGPADRCFAEELEQDDEKTYLSLPCHHDRENAVRKEKAAAASEPPKFLDKLRRLPRRSKANEKGVQSLRNGAARPFRFNNFIVKMLVAYTAYTGSTIRVLDLAMGIIDASLTVRYLRRMEVTAQIISNDGISRSDLFLVGPCPPSHGIAPNAVSRLKTNVTRTTFP